MRSSRRPPQHLRRMSKIEPYVNVNGDMVRDGVEFKILTEYLGVRHVSKVTVESVKLQADK